MLTFVTSLLIDLGRPRVVFGLQHLGVTTLLRGAATAHSQPLGASFSPEQREPEFQGEELAGVSVAAFETHHPILMDFPSGAPVRGVECYVAGERTPSSLLVLEEWEEGNKGTGGSLPSSLPSSHPLCWGGGASCLTDKA